MSILSSLYRSKITPVLQADESECALACLVMLLNYHQHSTSLPLLRQQYGGISGGLTLRQFVELAAKQALICRTLKLELDELVHLQCPCILHWDLQHYVILEKVWGNRAVIIDPASGKRVFSTQELDKHVTGVAVEVTPSPEFTIRREEKRLKISDLWQRILGIKRSLSLLFLLSALLQLFAIANPYYVQLVVDDVIVRNDHAMLQVVSGGFAIILILEILTSHLRQFSTLQLANQINLQITSNVFGHLIKLPVQFFSRRDVGDILTRVQSVQPIRDLLTSGLVDAILDGLMAIATLCVLLIYSAKLTLVVSCFLVIYIALRLLTIKPFQAKSLEVLKTQATVTSHLVESIQAIRAIQLNGLVNNRLSIWQNKLTNNVATTLQLGVWEIRLASVNKLLFGLENLIVIFTCATLVMSQSMTVGMLYAFIAYKRHFTSAIDGFVSKVIEYKLISVHLERLADIVFSEQGKLTNLPMASRYQSVPLLQVNNITFRHEGAQKPTLDDVSFTVKSKECIAIVGQSGSGKSTLIHCLMGLLPVQSGDIKANNHSIAKNNAFNQSIACVMQNDELFSGSIIDNISCFDEKPHIKRIEVASKLASIYDDIQALPMQFNTLVGPAGRQLSGGQIQRLFLARALYRRPKILFLDEASSHLDLATERAINKALNALKITRILVAHRPQTIQLADRVLELRNGKLHPVNTDKNQDKEIHYVP